MTNREFSIEAKQPSSKRRAQSSSDQQQPALRANTASQLIECTDFKGVPVATRTTCLQLLHGGLKRMQKRGACYEVADELRMSEPLFDDFPPSLETRASVHSKDYVVRRDRRPRNKGSIQCLILGSERMKLVEGIKKREQRRLRWWQGWLAKLLCLAATESATATAELKTGAVKSVTVAKLGARRLAGARCWAGARRRAGASGLSGPVRWAGAMQWAVARRLAVDVPGGGRGQ